MLGDEFVQGDVGAAGGSGVLDEVLGGL